MVLSPCTPGHRQPYSLYPLATPHKHVELVLTMCRATTIPDPENFKNGTPIEPRSALLWHGDAREGEDLATVAGSEGQEEKKCRVHLRIAEGR
jgi:hypothetical protein